VWQNMQDLIAWIGSSEAYNWITLLGAFAAIMTAAFTGYTASAQWRDRARRVNAEWGMDYHDSFLIVTCLVRNKTESTMMGERAVADGLGASLRIDGSAEKHESWPINATGVFEQIPPNQSATFRFTIRPDPAMLRSAASRYSARSMLWLTKLLWHTLQWRLASGPKVSITLTLRRKSSEMRPIRLTHTIRIYPDMAIKMAANIEASADKT